MRKIGFIFVIAVIALIWGCAEYAPDPEVTIIGYCPTVGVVYQDSIGDINTYTSLPIKMDTIKVEPTNRVDFVLDYLQVNYYDVNGTYLFTDNTLQPVNIPWKAGDVSEESDATIITENVLILLDWYIDLLPGIKYMVNNNMKTITAEIVFHGHAYYNEDKTFTTSMRIGVVMF